MLMVSKQRVMRHELNTDVNLIFSEMSCFIQSFTRQNISFIYTCHLYINAALSYELLYVSTCFGWYLYMLLPL